MTPAEQAVQSAIAMEAKKDSLRQMQNGDWKVSFTVSALDMDQRLSAALPGTRYQAVLVEIGDDEMPIAKSGDAKPQPDKQTPVSPVGAKPPRDWRDIQASNQAGMQCDKPAFWRFLEEECGWNGIENADDAAVAVRNLCKVISRKEFDADDKAKLRWCTLQDQFDAWNYASF